jgi:hypothetical protein
VAARVRIAVTGVSGLLLVDFFRERWAATLVTLFLLGLLIALQRIPPAQMANPHLNLSR